MIFQWLWRSTCAAVIVVVTMLGNILPVAYRRGRGGKKTRNFVPDRGGDPEWGWRGHMVPGLVTPVIFCFACDFSLLLL